MPINIDEIDPSSFTDNIEKSLRENVVELAETLAYNYYSNSFGDEFNLFVTRSKDIFKSKSIVDSFREKIDKNERVRNILIVGAGASHDSYKAFPTGKCLIEEVQDIYEKDIRTISFLEEKFIGARDEIKDITGKDKLNFENYLYLLSKFFVTQGDLREKIKLMTGFRYSVSLFNEIVAHLLKHAFLDVVINFNFEETLDHTIEEEIGKGNYHNIISDGNCVELEQVLVDGRLKVPIYIKPHGTFSHKSTLRFTNRHYFDLPNDIRIMLEGLISGKRGNQAKGRSKKEIQRVNLICVGFALESLEFNKILDKCLPPESVLYHIDWNPADPTQFFKDRGFNEFLTKAINHGRKISEGDNRIYRPISTRSFSQNRIPHNPTVERGNELTSPLGEMFSVIWRISYEFFKKSYKPRSIARHEILSYLFYEPTLGLLSLQGAQMTMEKRRVDREYIQKYNETHPKLFRDRILVELALALNRGNGMVDIAELLKGRIGLYYQKYEEAWAKSSGGEIRKRHTIFQLMNQFSYTLIKEYKDVNVEEVESLIEFPYEYKNGKNIFALTSVFGDIDIDDEGSFNAAVTDLSNDLRVCLRGLYVNVDDVVKAYEMLESKVDDFCKSFIKIIVDWKRKISKPYDRTRLERTVTIFYLLLRSPLLSRHFKVNFLSNFDKKVQNGKIYSEVDIPQAPDKQTMICELFRLFSKSASQHYFVIDPLPYSPVHYIWESFNKRNLIHTILGLSSEFNHLFHSGTWDSLLLVSEAGSMLNFLHKIEMEDKLKFKKSCTGKQIILICSYEAIRQLYPGVDDVGELIRKHKEHIAFRLEDGTYVLEHLTILLVNFNQHNHHVTIFLKSISHDSYDGNLAKKFTILSNSTADYYFNAIGSLYNYRRGFSNSIDPIHIGLVDQETTGSIIHRDQEKLLDIFALHLRKAFQFEFFFNRGAEWEKEPFLTELQREYRDNPNIENGVKKFLLSLYKKLSESVRS